MRVRICCRWAWIVLLALPGPSATALEVGGRIRAYVQADVLPSTDSGRASAGAVALDENLGLRLTLRQQAGPLTFASDVETTLVHGDGHRLRVRTGQDVVGNDGRRWQDLTTTLASSSSASARTRLDRLFVRYRAHRWNLLAGREALSLGNGLMFAPFDLFNPFSPTETDRDFKAGDDMLLAQRLFANGSDLQLIAVGHRDANGKRSGAAGSFGGQWHGFLGANEINLLAARHYSDRVVAMGVSRPVGAALLRTDVVAARVRSGGWRVSGVLNGDYSLIVGDRNLYLFAEYYYNGFGLGDAPRDASEITPDLRERLQRGDVFTLARQYIATGLRVEWHPLWTQNFLLISSLQDGSALVQSALVWLPDDNRKLEFAVTTGIGRPGREFGALPLAADDGPMSRRDMPTTGGSARFHVRYLRYF